MTRMPLIDKDRYKQLEEEGKIGGECIHAASIALCNGCRVPGLTDGQTPTNGVFNKTYLGGFYCWECLKEALEDYSNNR